MSNIKNFWSTPILRETCKDLEVERNYIISKIEELKNNQCEDVSDLENNTTINGFQPNYNFLNDSNCKNIISNLLEKYSHQFWKELSKNNPIAPKTVDLAYISWVVNYDIGGYQNQHTHKRGVMTGLWFLDVKKQQKNSGELHIHNPNVLSYSLGFYNETIKISPKTNDVIILPNWVPHNVSPTSAGRTVLVWDAAVI